MINTVVHVVTRLCCLTSCTGKCSCSFTT